MCKPISFDIFIYYNLFNTYQIGKIYYHTGIDFVVAYRVIIQMLSFIFLITAYSISIPQHPLIQNGYIGTLRLNV